MTNRTAEEKIIDEKNFRIDANTSHFQYMADRIEFFYLLILREGENVKNELTSIIQLLKSEIDHLEK
jgi:hypothetical protein